MPVTIDAIKYSGDGTIREIVVMMGASGGGINVKVGGFTRVQGGRHPENWMDPPHARLAAAIEELAAAIEQLPPESKK
jgi:hypothetical protein